MQAKAQRQIVIPGPAAPVAAARLPERAEELATLLKLTDRLYRASGLPEACEAALDAITSALGCERASILLFDENDVMRFVAWRGLSDKYRAAVDGHTPWKPDTRDPQPIFVADILATDHPDWLKETVTGEGVRGLGFIPLVAQNGVVGKFMTYYRAPHEFTPSETALAVHIARQLGFSIERARAEEARRRAERALRETEERFRLMSEHAPVMIWMSHADGSCHHLNRMLREFWDVEEDELDSFDWSTTIHPDDAEHVRTAIGGAIQSRSPVSLEARYRNVDGEYRTLATHARPRIAGDGAFMGMIGINVDTTERARADAHRDLLLAELSHRVKNMLAVVQGIARQTFRDTDSVAAARDTFEGRLLALATAHDLLTRTKWESASLVELARDALPMRRERPQITLSGPDVLLDPRQTLAITMALHELFTNAIKYGALSTEEGRVTLEWRLSDGPAPVLCVEWRESGGPAAAPPAREGFGTRLIRQVLTHDLGGEVTMRFEPQGLVCRAELPLRR